MINPLKIFVIVVFGCLALLCSAPISKYQQNQYTQLKIDSLSQQAVLFTNLADKYYKKGIYDSAAYFYDKITDNAGRNILNEEIYFKAAYSFYQLDSLNKSLFYFKYLLTENPNFILRDYVEYFIAGILKKQNNTDLSEKLLRKIFHSTKSPYLKSLSAWLLARMISDPEEQLQLLNNVRLKFIPDSIEEFVRFKLSLLDKKNPEAYRKYLIRIAALDFRKEFEEYVFNLVDSLKWEWTDKEKIELLDIFSRKDDHRYFDNWYLFLSESKGNSKKFNTKINLIRALYLYNHRKYTSAFRLLKQLKDKYLSKEDRGEKYLHIARCNARLGFINDAIRAYYFFQKKFPKHKLAADALWWIALTYEQRKDFANAKRFLDILSRKYRKEGTEAKFRLIFMDILNGHYSKALRELERIEKRLTYNDYLRALYWKRYLHIQLGNFAEADKITPTLLNDPFQNVYTLNVFINTKKDSLPFYLNSKPTEQVNFSNLMPEFSRKLDRVLTVENLLGAKFARYEIQSIRKIPYSHEHEVILLANLNEKLGNFGIAYALLRDLYYARYLKKNWKIKLHMIKRLYPLYYEELVEKYCEQFNVDPFLVYGIMKRESMFQHNIKSYANAYGLLQLLPSTARRLKKNIPFVDYRDPVDLFNPEVNIPLGIYYIQKLLNDFNKHYPSVIASYNAGEYRVRRWRDRYKTDNDLLFIELMPIEQTRKYVKYVLYYYYGYQMFYNPDGNIRLNITIH